jgi:superfamily I DNA/RNA helicase
VVCRVLGREIGQGLTALVNKMKAKTIDRLIVRLDEHFAREQAAAMAKGDEQKADALADKVETIKVFIEQLGENRRTIPALIEDIESMFADTLTGNEVRLMTGHKAKGLEADRVFILDWFRCPSKYARQAWQMQQEYNLMYVMATRSRSELYFVTQDTFGKKLPGEVKDAAKKTA